MPRRTYERDGQKIELADDVDELVSERAGGANPAKARDDNGVTKAPDQRTSPQ